MEQVTAEHQPRAPAWFSEAMNELRREVKKDLRQEMKELRQGLRRELNEIRQTLSLLHDIALESVNSTHQSNNYRIMKQRNRGNNPYIPLFRYRNRNHRALLGDPLPGRPQPAVPLIMPAFGATIPSPPFPCDIADVERFTMDQIEALSMILNHHFGIVAEDSVEVCRCKMKNYLIWMVR